MTDGQLRNLLLTTLISTPLLARFAGLWAIRTLGVDPKRIAAWMPSLPARAQATGEPGARFERRVRACEALVLDALAQNSTGVEASVLATQLAQDPEVVAEILTRLRAKIACKLQVTRLGRLLHDFQPADIAAEQRARLLAWPSRLVWFSLAVFANIGATWFVFVGIFAGLETLHEVWKVNSDARLLTAAEGLGAMVLVVALSLLAGPLVQLLVMPLGATPRLIKALRAAAQTGDDGSADTPEPEIEADQALTKAERRKKQAQSVHAGGASSNPDSSQSSRSGSRWDVGNLGDIGDIGEGFPILLLIIVIGAILALLAGGLWLIVLWARGLWRAVARAGDPVRDLAPARWVRVARKLDKLEAFVPTNDLAMRLLRAFRPLLAKRSADEALSGRILALAAAQHGRVAVLDLVLSEGLAPEDALAIGAQLSGRLGGDLLVSAGGDIDFCFPNSVLPAVGSRSKPLPEYAQLAANGKVSGVPVNIPGITLEHVHSAARLAAGPYAMIAGLWIYTFFSEASARLSPWEVTLAGVFCILAPGTMALAAVTRQLAAESAKLGMLRDVRRAAVAEIAKTLAGQGEYIDLTNLTNRAVALFAHADANLLSTDVERVIAGFIDELDLNVAESRFEGRDARQSLAILPLRKRMESLALLRTHAAPAPNAASDDVVFVAQ